VSLNDGLNGRREEEEGKKGASTIFEAGFLVRFFGTGVSLAELSLSFLLSFFSIFLLSFFF
jgi:hypothetical protein